MLHLHPGEAKKGAPPGSRVDPAERTGGACAAALLAPTRWIPRLKASPHAPFIQRRAEVCAVRTLLAVPFSAAAGSASQERISHAAASAAAAAATPAFIDLLRSAVGSEEEPSGVGCVGVAVVLRAGAALMEAVRDEACREKGDARRDDDVAGKEEKGIERNGDTNQPHLDELRRLADALIEACRAAGERRVQRRVEAAAALVQGGMTRRCVKRV